MLYNADRFVARRLLQHSTTAPTASNSKISSIPRTCDSPPSHGIDAARLLAATNSEDALKILNQAASAKTTFSMCSEATKLMSTLQMSAIPSVSEFNQSSCYGYGQSGVCPQPFDVSESKGSIGRFNVR